jgi:uncharacterized membrane protein
MRAGAGRIGLPSLSVQGAITVVESLLNVVPVATGRIAALDIARTVALIGMATYHFTYDLEMFGYIPPGTAVSGGWAILARVVAGSFLFLSGVSLYLAHGNGIRWGAYLRRLAMLAAAAAIITLGTRYAMPDSFIFFGILHSIAFAGVIGLAFLRLPALLTLVVAAAVVFAKPYLQTGLFDAPPLAFLGLSTWPVRSVDFVPAFPWIAACLAGIGVAKLAAAAGFWDLLRGRFARAGRILGWPGRHSLPIYLLHQPLLIGGLWLVTKALR